MSEAVLFPAMDAMEATLMRVLCGEGRCLTVMVDGAPFNIIFEPFSTDDGKPALTLPIDFSGEVSRMAIQFRPDGVLARRIPGGLPVGPDILRKTLLGVMCREVIDALARSTNLSLKLAPSEPSDEGLHSIRFLVRSQGNASAEPEAWGTLDLGEKLTQALISAASVWPRREGPLARSLQLDCSMVLASLTIPSVELLSLRRGDMLLLGATGSLIPEVRLPDGRRFKCPLPLEERIIDSSQHKAASNA